MKLKLEPSLEMDMEYRKKKPLGNVMEDET